MLQEPGHAIPQSSHQITLNSASHSHLILSRDHLSPSPQRSSKTSCTLNRGYFSSGALNSFLCNVSCSTN
uniref:Uncharacterized protein n=2 Tax=Ursus TaxID=9639 RepID=A0A452UBA4_URSMA